MSSADAVARDSQTAKGEAAARLIWDDADGVDDINDPRTSEFANAVVIGLANALAAQSGAIKKMMRSAASAAEDLNVEPFQGLVEVIQNADDLRATEVRFAFRENAERRHLLIVHNGEPVACQHVLGMVLPFLTTKTNRTDQRGRFGVGLKTLKRIADRLSIHSHPYHFCADQLSLELVRAENALPGFYDPAHDTLLVLDLKKGFDESELRAWLDAWEDDGLIFLTSVSGFRWCNLTGKTVQGRTLEFGAWQAVKLARPDGMLTSVSRREVRGDSDSWIVWKASLPVPKRLHPAHKARSETTHISVAVPRKSDAGSLYIGFKTRVPVGLSFSIDAQFDPSTTREALISNAWNDWLIQRCGDVLAEIGSGLLVTAPKEAWRIIPLSIEHVGSDADRWLRTSFESSFNAARKSLGEQAVIALQDGTVPLAGIAYEEEELGGLLTNEDIEALVENVRALPMDLRDRAKRWRAVLDEIDVSTRVGTNLLLGGFGRELFKAKKPTWWVKAARVLIDHHDQDELFGVPIWLSDDDRVLTCQRKGETAKPLILGGDASPFGARWNLLDRLHPAYGLGDSGEVVTTWLNEKAAFRTNVDAETELAAFAERFSGQGLEIEDADLRELRGRFDELSDLQAEKLGHDVGAVLRLDGFVYKAGKVHRQKVSPRSAYLCKTLDSDSPYWPTAAGTLPGIQWIAARYDEQLKTGATGRLRKRTDGTISRGPRKFLMLLGAETAPRLNETGTVVRGNATRIRELAAAGAEQVPHDYVSPDLERVLAPFPKLSKKERRIRSPAMLKALSRAWERLYASKKTVPSQHVARVHTYWKSAVTADWLIKLRETEWIAIGKGELVAANAAVIRTSETQTLYGNAAFVVDVDPDELGADFAAALGLVISVRVSDLVSLLRDMRDGEEPPQEAQVMQVYRNIANHVPKTIVWNTRVGDLTVQDLRAQFADGQGLVLTGRNIWCRPSDLLSGKDIFHDRARFVPAGPSYAALWEALNVQEPSLDDCLPFLKKLASRPYDVGVTASLINVYRYMEPLLPDAERRHRERLRTLPLYCGDAWQSDRPIILVEDDELRAQLAKALRDHRFWTPPCEMRDLPFLVDLAGVKRSVPKLSVIDERVAAQDRGDDFRAHFDQAVDHLSDELARNDPDTRERMLLGWDDLRAIPLLVYPGPIAVRAEDPGLSSTKLAIRLQALITTDPVELHVWEDAVPKREHGGRAIASLFPSAARRHIEAEWVVAWQEGRETTAPAIRLASDAEHAEATRDRAAKISAAPKRKISVSTPTGKGPGVKLRKLKDDVGPIADVTVVPGFPPTPQSPPNKPTLHDAPPPSKPTDPTARSAPTAYSDKDLEQRGWELLVQALESSAEDELVDFRNRHGVGADGVIDWKTFVEMKATARSAQTSIEMTNAEYERAKERGNDFILALVSGLEEGYRDEVRLILDPANRATVRPLNGIKLVGLTEAPSILIRFGNPPAESDSLS